MCGIHATPFLTVPHIMTKYIVMESARKLNYFPSRGGISQYYSPCIIMHKIPLDFVKECDNPLFTYGVAHSKPNPTNTQESHPIDSLYLRSVNSEQGGHEVLNLATGLPITHHKFTQLPMPLQSLRQWKTWHVDKE